MLGYLRDLDYSHQVLCTCILILVLCVLWALQPRYALTLAEETTGLEMLDRVDSDELEVGETGAAPWGDEPWRVTASNRTRFLGAVVREAKNEFGVPEDNAANRLVLRKFIRDKMVDRGMRPSHISTFLDFAIEMVFVPSINQLQAKRLRKSAAWVDRVTAYEEAGAVNGLFNLWGHLRRLTRRGSSSH